MVLRLLGSQDVPSSWWALYVALGATINVLMYSRGRLIDLGCSLDMTNYHLSRCTMLHELGQVGNTQGLSTEEELNAHYSKIARLKFVPQAQALYNSKKANKRKRTAEMLKDAMYRTAAVEMFHRGAVLVRKERLLLITLMIMLIQ